MFRASLRRLIVIPTVGCPPFATFLPNEISTSETGTRFEEGWSMSFLHAPTKKTISPWHNISLKADIPEAADDRRSCSVSRKTVFHFVNEISRGMREKVECLPGKEQNYFAQDRNKKDGSLRKFTYGDMPFSYGFLPRTFENPHVTDRHTGLLGDGDPVDVVFLPSSGSSATPAAAGTASAEQQHHDGDPSSPFSVPAVGEVRAVRVVGAFALLDQGETDWKMLAVPAESDVKDIDGIHPAVLFAIHDWFKNYKTTDGKPENQFAFDGKPIDAALAVDIVAELSGQYIDAVCGKMQEKMKGEIWTP